MRKATYRRRGAPPDSLTRAAFARACNVDRRTAFRWDRAGWLRPRYITLNGKARPYYTASDVERALQMRFWRSGRGMRLARRLVKQRKKL